jgi:hypothetical protein
MLKTSARATSMLESRRFFGVGRIHILGAQPRICHGLCEARRNDGRGCAVSGAHRRNAGSHARAFATSRKSQHGYSSASPAKCLILTQDLAAIEFNYQSRNISPARVQLSLHGVS